MSRVGRRAPAKGAAKNLVLQSLVNFNNKDNNVFYTKLNTLRVFKSSISVEPLIVAMKIEYANYLTCENRNCQRLYDLINVCGEIGDSRFIDPLLDLLTKNNANVYSSAIMALVQINDKRVEEPLIHALDKFEDHSFLEAIVRSLNRVDINWKKTPAAHYIITSLIDKNKLNTSSQANSALKAIFGYSFEESADYKYFVPIKITLESR